MAQNKGLNDLLKWSIENSTLPDANNNNNNNNNDPAAAAAAATAPKSTTLTPDLLAELFGGPSDAELMRAALALAADPDPGVGLESRLTALDNLEQLVESLDNANLLAPLGLWAPLLALLAHGEARVRRMAAWCVGTAVQNNAPCQERLVALGGVERLVAMALGERVAADPAPAPDSAPVVEEEKTNGEGANGTSREGEAGEKKEEQEEDKEDKEVRRKAVYALSSAVRNYQPAMDVATSELRKKGEQVDDKIDAADMGAVDNLIDGLKEKAKSAA